MWSTALKTATVAMQDGSATGRPGSTIYSGFFFLVAKFPLTCIPNLSKMPQDVTFTA